MQDSASSPGSFDTWDLLRHLREPMLHSTCLYGELKGIDVLSLTLCVPRERHGIFSMRAETRSAGTVSPGVHLEPLLFLLPCPFIENKLFLNYDFFWLHTKYLKDAIAYSCTYHLNIKKYSKQTLFPTCLFPSCSEFQAPHVS